MAATGLRLRACRRHWCDAFTDVFDTSHECIRIADHRGQCVCFCGAVIPSVDQGDDLPTNQDTRRGATHD